MKTLKKRIVFFLLYLFFQLPVAYLGINNIKTKDLLFFQKTQNQVFFANDPKQGDYKLYDCTSAHEFGTISIEKFNGKDDEIIISYKTKPISGYHEIFNKHYDFEDINITNFSIEKKIFKGEIYWIGSSENFNVILVSINNTLYHKPIPEPIYNINNEYYLCSIITNSDYFFIQNGNSSVSINKIIANNIDKSYSSAIFYMTNDSYTRGITP
jgi:hypothetical protein